MKKNSSYQIIALDCFIEATRDSGYKTFATAVAELIDNSIESGATQISLEMVETGQLTQRIVSLTLQDNGSGMRPSVLRLALQFGGSTRFNSRKGFGRYGMGLPNASLSQTRRFEVYTWTSSRAVWWSYLDADRVAAGEMLEVPKPTRRVLPKRYRAGQSKSGTLVCWMNCDRINSRDLKALVAAMHEVLGRTFRNVLTNRLLVTINGERVQPIDPLFLTKGNNLQGAAMYGPPLTYEIQVPGKTRTSTVVVRFSELPIENWQNLSNKEKRIERISKRAGLSILRAGREIDYGWFFMGAKRKENYDDWWRGEILFSAELDQLFGVTHTKQGIRPTQEIVEILSPDIERIAHDLNSRARRRFSRVKSRSKLSLAETVANDRDYLIEPPTRTSSRKKSVPPHRVGFLEVNRMFPGFKYRIEAKTLKDPSFFIPIPSELEVLIQLNEQHPFYQYIYSQAVKDADFDKKHFLTALQLLILSAARAECSVTTARGRRFASSLRNSWSNILAAFLA